MPACRRCGAENPPGGRYCSACGAPLPGGASESRGERKVVTVVFADLVGFTSRAERLDPEDVGRLLTPFYARVRAELEGHGGTVEKFIGDAVMAVFGAPVAHEDDPERALRAAFGIRGAIEELNAADPELDLHVRIGVATGEVFVRLGADPALGQAPVAGDVVNTAARLQQAAPADAIVVGDATRRATAEAVEYRPLEPVVAKGKSERVPAWEALALGAREEGRSQRRRAPLVGRDDELAVLLAAADRARNGRAVETVSLVGDAGLGKSRLAWELHDALHGRAEPFVWRHGRSLPYGAGVTFWALSEVVKAEAGILETDPADLAEGRLRASVHAAAAPAGEAAVLERHLRPLVGLGGEAGERRESFAAWRRYLHGVAQGAGLLVLGLEDLQWADDGMLDFVEHLASWGTETPLLLVCTARPELLDRRPQWPGVLRLEPLEPGETVTLLGALLAGTDVRADLWPELLAQTAGNPLYAEEYARMLRERPREGGLTLPGSVQAIIAARIDALEPVAKALLQDAAVVGKGFWPGVLEHISGRSRAEVEGLVGELDRKGLVHPVSTSAVAGEPQLAFSHVLIRDVAYGQIPREQRVERHRRVAEWIAELAPDRIAGTAEMTAYHYGSALEYARLLRLPTDDLAEPARVALGAAGDHAVALGAFATAVRFYREALALWPEGAQASRLRLALGTARFRAEGGGAEELEQAREELLAGGELEAAAEADVLLAELRFRRGEVDEAFERLETAARGLAARPPCRQRAHVLSTLSRFRAAEYQSEDAIRLGREALDMATELGLDEIRAHALNNIGYARVTLGDREGVSDLERSVRISAALGSVESLRGYLNLGTTLAHLGDLERAFAVHAEGRAAAERLGDATGIRWFAVEGLFEGYWRGRWDDAVALADRLLAEAAGVPDYYTELGSRTVRCWIRLARGDVAGAEEDARRYVAIGREVRYPQALFPALALGARVHAAAGRSGDALEVARELLAAWRASGVETAAFWTADLAFALVALGAGADFLEAAREVAAPTPWLEAAILFASGDADAAADRYAAIGSLPDEAYARLRSSRPGDAHAFVRRAAAAGYGASAF